MPCRRSAQHPKHKKPADAPVCCVIHFPKNIDARSKPVNKILQTDRPAAVRNKLPKTNKYMISCRRFDSRQRRIQKDSGFCSDPGYHILLKQLRQKAVPLFRLRRYA